MIERIIIGIAFVGVLIYAAIYDARTHEIPDKANVMLLVMGAVQLLFNFSAINLLNMISGILIGALPFFIAAVLTDGIGGGDMKLIGSMGSVLGLSGCISAMIIGMILFLAGSFIIMKIRKAKIKDKIAFAMAPYLAVGGISVYVLAILQQIR